MRPVERRVDSRQCVQGAATQRRDGRFVLQAGFPIKYHAPLHAAVVDKITLSEQLLGALWKAREEWDAHEWQKWREAIVTFNRANSESQDVSWRVDWILMCGAFQRILGKAAKALHKQDETVNELRKHLLKPAKRLGADHEIVCEWVREFCAMRGDFAHGKRHPTQPRKWREDQTHLSVAAIAFPLLIRLLLQEKHLYTLRLEDHAALAALPLYLNQAQSLSQQPIEWWRMVLDQKLAVAISMGLKESSPTGQGANF